MMNSCDSVSNQRSLEHIEDHWSLSKNQVDSSDAPEPMESINHDDSSIFVSNQIESLEYIENMDQVFSSVFVSNRRSPALNQRSLEHIDKMEQVYFPVFVADKSLSKD
jgi:hypothetical protein